MVFITNPFSAVDIYYLTFNIFPGAIAHTRENTQVMAQWLELLLKKWPASICMFIYTFKL